jgi:hypothetical protein
LLDAIGQSFEITQQALLDNRAVIPTSGEVIQEHIDLLVRPSRGTVKTYRSMLDLHVQKVIGHVPVDKLDYRMIAYWVKSMMAKGRSPKTIKNVRGLNSASMNTAAVRGYVTRNPCRGRAVAEHRELHLSNLTGTLQLKSAKRYPYFWAQTQGWSQLYRSP